MSRCWCYVEILNLIVNQDSEIEVWSRLVIWTQPSGPLCLWQCLICSIVVAIVLPSYFFCLSGVINAYDLILFVKNDWHGALRMPDIFFWKIHSCIEQFLKVVGQVWGFQRGSSAGHFGNSWLQLHHEWGKKNTCWLLNLKYMSSNIEQNTLVSRLLVDS